ncbi:MAG: hypothetical protein WBJ68_04090 [Candidatus Dechloromonas phosphoritropha]
MHYPTFFEPFSQQRLFTALGSTVSDINIFIPGSTTAALSRGFGVVFSDVDANNSTSLQVQTAWTAVCPSAPAPLAHFSVP